MSVLDLSRLRNEELKTSLLMLRQAEDLRQQAKSAGLRAAGFARTLIQEWGDTSQPKAIDGVIYQIDLLDFSITPIESTL